MGDDLRRVSKSNRNLQILKSVFNFDFQYSNDLSKYVYSDLFIFQNNFILLLS